MNTGCKKVRAGFFVPVDELTFVETPIITVVSVSPFVQKSNTYSGTMTLKITSSQGHVQGKQGKMLESLLVSPNIVKRSFIDHS